MVELLSSSKNIHSTSSTEVNQNSTSPPQRPPRQHGNQGKPTRGIFGGGGVIDFMHRD